MVRLLFFSPTTPRYLPREGHCRREKKKLKSGYDRKCPSIMCIETLSFNNQQRTHTQKYPSGLAGLINKLQFHIGAAQNKACPHHSVLLPLFPRDFNSRPNLIFWAGRIWPGPSLRFYPRYAGGTTPHPTLPPTLLLPYYLAFWWTAYIPIYLPTYLHCTFSLEPSLSLLTH